MMETDKDDRPLEDIQILNCEVYVDPFKDIDEMLIRERANRNEESNIDNTDKPLHPKPGNRQEEEALEASERAKRSRHDENVKVYRTGVGKFIHDLDQFDTKSVVTNKRGNNNDESSLQMNEDVIRKKKKIVLKSQLTDFSSW
nr:SJCHGC08874 protein [Schistosoma japonicum]